jgi:transcriptional regulator with XRE-family HTH domain
MKLKAARESKGWTQGQLAAEMGVHRETVARWEAGSREPDFDTLRKLSTLLEVTVDDLLREDAEQAPAEAPAPESEVRS